MAAAGALVSPAVVTTLGTAAWFGAERGSRRTGRRRLYPRTGRRPFGCVCPCH